MSTTGDESADGQPSARPGKRPGKRPGMRPGMRPVIMVTGASRGIGAATARLAAEQGFDVVIGYRSNRTAAESVAEACAESGADTLAQSIDLGDEASIVDFFAASISRFGRLDAFVNNAATLHPVATTLELTAERLAEVFRINAIGPMLAAREAVRAMSTELGGAGGAIVNVSSVASVLGSPNEFVDYAATKGALDTFTVGLAKEVATQGIRVNAVRPGLVDTDLHDLAQIPDRLAKLTPNIPMRRVGEPIEVASAICWLASPAASYVTGALLNVSGGR